jgi:hypothetical protein
MDIMKRLSAATLILIFGGGALLSALDSSKASYLGGTFEPFKVSKMPVRGRVETAEEQFTFFADDKALANHRLRIEYDWIQDLEFGQKTGRRVRTAIGTSVLLGPMGLLSLAAKGRQHYLTVGYTDEGGKEQVAILELGKDIVRATLTAIEMRSGKQVEYQDNDSRKWAMREGLEFGSSN